MHPMVLAVTLVAVATSVSATLATKRDLGNNREGDGHHPLPVGVDWNATVCTCNTVGTLQVVVNPLLNKELYPFADKMWYYLGELNAELVRFQGWFPYPQWGVAELKPPNPVTRETFWNFTGIMSQLGPFMANVKSAVWDFSTMPEWFINSNYNVTTAMNPANSSHVDWHYQTGSYQPNTTWLAAKYFGRVAKYLIHGWMIDEFGRNISGGPAYGLEKVKFWEVLNEPEGFLSFPQYTSIYDAVVDEIRDQADPTHQIQFQGLALCDHYEFNSWYKPWFTQSNHMASAWDAVAKGSISFHFYALPHHGTRNSTWGYALFEILDDFVEEVRIVKGIRDRMSPTTKMSIDEFGTIIPKNHPSDLYYNAANGVFAVGYARLSELDVFLIGCSQFAGTPPMPQYGWNHTQYPSVSMMNWTNGEPNARYWGLKLLIEEFSVGDKIVTMERPARNKICAARSDYPLGFSSKTPLLTTLSCPEPGSYISSFGKVDMTDQVGNCNDGWKVIHGNCSDNGTLLKAVTKKCLGQKSCEVSWYDMKFWFNGTKTTQGCEPYYGHMVIEAFCSGTTKGYATPSGYLEDRIYLQARKTVDGGKKKVLFVNKNNDYATLHLPEMKGATARIVDSYVEARTEIINGTELVLKPFSMGVLILQQ